MAQLYFKFGAMGSSKTANALMARFNYEERGQETPAGSPGRGPHGLIPHRPDPPLHLF